MIAAWMIYTTAVTLLLFAGARAADYVARAIGAPARFVWAAGIAIALTLSGRALMTGRQTHREVPVPAAHALAFSVETASTPATDVSLGWPALTSPPTRIESLLTSVRGNAATVRQTAGRVDVAAFERWNRPLVEFWIVATVLALSLLATSVAGLRRLERTLTAAVVDDHRVLVSNDVGPALFGVVRARIVLPRWVLSLPQVERHIILTHERQHAAAFDPALIYAAAFALALQPWNIPLWALVANLRLALEGDCDRRVLRMTGDARRYGRLLVAVHARKTPELAAYIAFVNRPSNLERRIRRMSRRPRLISAAGIAASIATVLLATTAWTVASPVRRPTPPAAIGSPDSTARQEVRRLEAVVTVAKRADQPIELPPQLTPSRAEHHLELAPAVVQPSSTPLLQKPETRMAQCLSGKGPGEFTRIGTPLPDGGCSIDGDVLVVAMDNARILVALRDTAEAGAERGEFFIFGSTPGTVPPTLSWWSDAGHAEFRDGDMVITSGSRGQQSVAIGRSASELRARYPDALSFQPVNVQVFRSLNVSWSLLKQLPTAGRCSPDHQFAGPVYVIDGVVAEAPTVATAPRRGCFMLQGRAVELP